MLYPNIINIKKSSVIIKILLLVSMLICLISILINELTSPNFKWSAIVIIGIVYVWVTVLYAIRKNVNIASHVLLQTIAVSILTIMLDIIIGYRKWSFSLALPIIISVANITMFILTIVSENRYFKYAIYQIILSILSGIVILLIALEGTYKVIAISITGGISIFTLIVSIILCGGDLKQEVLRLFHI